MYDHRRTQPDRLRRGVTFDLAALEAPIVASPDKELLPSGLTADCLGVSLVSGKAGATWAFLCALAFVFLIEFIGAVTDFAIRRDSIGVCNGRQAATA